MLCVLAGLVVVLLVAGIIPMPGINMPVEEEAAGASTTCLDGMIDRIYVV